MFYLHNHLKLLYGFLFIGLLTHFTPSIDLYAQDKKSNKKGSKEITVLAKKVKKKRKKKKAPSRAKFDLSVSLFGGGRVNYLSYKVKTPALGASVNTKLSYKLTDVLTSIFRYNFFIEKQFNDVDQSSSTLDKMTNYLSARLNYKASKKLTWGFNVNYKWVLKPDWPDHYQTNPAVFSAAFNRGDIQLLPTDRYSYHRIRFSVSENYKIRDYLPLFGLLGYTRKIAIVDSNFSANNPNHLTPSDYHVLLLTVGIKYKKKRKLLNGELSNTLKKTWDTVQLSRDATTGITHFSTTPNPLYEEINNNTTLKVIFNFRKQKLKITPSYNLEINIDEFQGYYSFIGNTFGLEIAQKLSKSFKYKFKASGEIQSFGSNSYGTSASHIPLTSGSRYFKHYIKLKLKTIYSVSRHLDLFFRSFLVIKNTNFPNYVPGVNPTSGTRNYDIDFSYTNFSFDLGVTYKL